MKPCYQIPIPFEDFINRHRALCDHEEDPWFVKLHTRIYRTEIMLNFLVRKIANEKGNKS